MRVHFDFYSQKFRPPSSSLSHPLGLARNRVPLIKRELFPGKSPGYRQTGMKSSHVDLVEEVKMKIYEHNICFVKASLSVLFG